MMDNSSGEYGLVATVFVAGLISVVVYILNKGWHARRLFIQLQGQNMVNEPNIVSLDLSNAF
jgi:hypothetical protein